MSKTTPHGHDTPAPDGGNGKIAFDPLDAEYLRDRAVPIDLALKCGVTSMTDSIAQKFLPERLGLRHKSLPCGGIIIPYLDTEDGVTRYRVRLRQTEFTTRPIEGSHHGESTTTWPKFVTTADAEVIPYFPPAGMPDGWKADTSVPLFFAEGPIKALALLAVGHAAIGLGGVEAGFHDVADWHDAHHLDLHPMLRRVRWTGRLVYLASDAGRTRNPSVARGEAKLALLLRQAGAVVRLIELPFDDGHDVANEFLYSSKDQGPDDFIARYNAEKFRALVDAAVPADPIEQVKAAPDAAACRRLLGHLPFQTALAVGGQRLIGPVAEEMKRRKTGIAIKGVKEAAADYEQRSRVQTRGSLPEWATALTKNASGTIKGTVANATTILSHDPKWAGVIAYDLFAEASVLRREPPWDPDVKPKKPFAAGQLLEEEDASRLTAWLERSYETTISTAMAHEIIEVVAHSNAFHPARDYLNLLVWDGISRVAGKDALGHLTTYAGVEDSAYVRCVGRWLMIGAVARIMSPGCKLDTMLILEGPQGKKKSTWLNTLFGDDWFSDTLSEIGSKDSYQDLRGKWCVEMGELDALSRAEASTAKKFIAKKRDNYRPSYGRRNRDVARQGIFAGSVNLDAYLKDFTGNRRFHPVKCTGTIDIEATRRDRDQLWAEAVQLYRADERWWPDDDEAKLCEVEQEDRRQRDPWEDKVERGLIGIDETTTEHILDNILMVAAEQQHRGHETRVGQVMVTLGWTKHRKREDGSRGYVYRRPNSPADGTTLPDVNEEALRRHAAEAAALMDAFDNASVMSTDRKRTDATTSTTAPSPPRSHIDGLLIEARQDGDQATIEVEMDDGRIATVTRVLPWAVASALTLPRRVVLEVDHEGFVRHVYDREPQPVELH